MNKINYEPYNIGASLDRKGVTTPTALAVGITLWATGLVAIIGATIGKEIYDNYKLKQKTEINQLMEPRDDSIDFDKNKLQDIKQSYARPDKLVVNKTYQLAPTFEVVAKNYLN
ncbi:MAG: hypothetical protein ACLFN8_00475 [Candidatus Woesearchaeota archaeon]